jgi:alpha-galactosidase
MAKIAFIGAGSVVFAKNLIGDVLSYPELAQSELALMDIDEERLRTSETVAHRVAAALDARPAITATTDRRAAVDGADHVITMFQVGGYRPSTVVDFEIPARYGLRQTIADTLGIGGIMRALRTIPVLLDLCRDIEELAPDAYLLQYVNPMAMNCWAVERATNVKAVGLCHSVHGTAKQLAHDLDVPIEEIDYLAAGINHMAFYLRFARDGEDLLPRLRDVTPPEWNRVRYEVLKHFGYFVTESSEHFAEYVPWFIKADRPELVERFNVPLDEYLRRCEEQIEDWERLRASLEHDDELTVARTDEYGSGIIHAVETGEPFSFYGNVRNDGLIENLPPECCVEVPCTADANGITPHAVGTLPPAARFTHDDEHQRAAARGRSRTHGLARACLPRRDARSAHGGRALTRSDQEPGRRATCRARRAGPRAPVAPRASRASTAASPRAHA